MEVTFTQSKMPKAPKPEPTAAAAQPPKTPPTAEELAQRTKDLYAAMNWGDVPADPKGTVVDPGTGAPEPPAPGPEPQPGTLPAEPQPEPQPEPEPEPEPSPRELVRETAREVAREVTRALTEEPEPQPVPAPAFEFSAEDAETHRVLEYVGRNDASKAGMAAAFAEWCKRAYEYQTQWMEANPGKEFDSSATEHDEFYAQQPEIDPAWVDRERINMIADERAERKYQERMKPREEAEAREKAWQREAPGIANRLELKMHAMVTQAAPELAKLLTANGRPSITDATVAALEEADPIAKAILDKVTREDLEPMIMELEKASIPEIKHQLHPVVKQFIQNHEREMSKAPRSAQVRNGAQWITLGEYNSRLGEINGMKVSDAKKDQLTNELNRNYWALTVNDVSDLVVDFCAKKAQGLIQEQDALAQRKYNRSGVPTNRPAAAPAAQPQSRPAQPGRTVSNKPFSPSVGSQPMVTTTPGVVGSSAKSFGDTAVDVNFPK